MFNKIQSFLRQRSRGILGQPCKKSYSQTGEDLILSFVLKSHSITCPVYIDIGANHPTELSNTWLLYQQGGAGFVVEPNPAYNAMYRRIRSRDVMHNVGISGSSGGSIKYYQMAWPAFNTFDEAFAAEVQARYAGRCNIVGTSLIPIVPINDFLGGLNLSRLDVLSLDAEGYDYDILSSLDFSRWSPLLVCVEQVSDSLVSQAVDAGGIGEILSANGYSVVAKTPFNVVYERR